MSERIFIEGNAAISQGAATAGCQAFYGYPITPQNEIIEWFAREFPKMGRKHKLLRALLDATSGSESDH